MNEAKRGGVQAIAFAGGRWTVVEDMAEVSVALAAEDFGAHQAEAKIRRGGDVRKRDRRPETGPTGIGIELLLRAKDSVAAADATVDTRGVLVPVEVVERRFRSAAPSDRELLAC